MRGFLPFKTSDGVGCLLAVLAVIAAGPPTRAASLVSPGPARITGRVVDAKTRAGIGSVQVRLDAGLAEVTTATDGSFEFSDVAEGPHQLVAVLAGFVTSAPVAVTVRTGADATVELEYSLSVTTEVRGAADEPPASPPTPALGSAELTGMQVAAAVGGLDDVSRVMQLRPGVTPSQDDRNDLLVRGGGAYETTVRMDGFELPTGSHFAWPGAAGGGLSLIPSAVIQRVSLETSGFSVAFGERASAVMDVDLKSGAREAIRGRIDATAGGVLGLAQGRLPAPSGGSGSWLAAARRSILQVAFSRGSSTAVPSYVEAMGNVDLPLSKVHRLHALVLRSSDGLDVDWEPTSKTTITGEQDLGLVGVRLDSAWSPRTQTALSVSWASYSSVLSEMEQSLSSFVNRSHEHFLRARAEVRHSLGRRGGVRTGLAMRQSDVDFFLQDGASRNEWNIVVPAVHSTWQDQFVDAAGYADGTWTAGRLELGAGVRADWSGLTSAWYASPRARLEYRPSSRWRLMGGWGQYRQDIPSIWMGSNAANRTLDPISCEQTTVGAEGELWRGAWLTVEGFWKRYDGYPIDPAVPSRVLISAGTDFESPLVGKLVPAGLVHANGVDTSVSQRIGRVATVSLGYSYWDVAQYNLEKTWIPADYDIRHQARLWLAWHGAKTWTASALWRYSSGRPYTPYDVAASVKAGAGRYDRTKTNAYRYPAYHRLDLRAERVWVLRRTALTAFAEVDNVYNRDNIYLYEWSKGLKQPQPILQWGITPIAGVRIEF
jgi:hypothetical protein